jgi:hypothetical protein
LTATPRHPYGLHMNVALARAAVGLCAALALVTVQQTAAAAVVAQQIQGVAFDVESLPNAQSTFAACAQMVDVLAEHGWDVRGFRVRIQGNRFDATSPAADLVLGTNWPSEDSAFILASTLVERQIGRSVGEPVARQIAQTVAAHLAPPDAARRRRWEVAWQQRLADGDVLTTALPELLWRTGGDAALRRSARADWPASAFAALAALGVDDPVRSLGELAVAGLIDPAALGFHSPPVPQLAPTVTQANPDVWFDGAGVRIVSLQDDSGAVAVLPLESDGAQAWVAVRYALTDTFDVVPVNARAEVTVPLRGVAWAGVVVVGGAAEAHMSLGIRPVPDYPVEIKRWDFLANDRNVTLSWETLRQDGLQAFVVEALESGDAGSWKVVRRTILPVAEQGESQLGYTFVDEDRKDVAAYRLLALTADGFLAEVGCFPVDQHP